MTQIPPPTLLRRTSGRPPSPDRKSPVEVRECVHHGLADFALYGRAQPRWRCKRCVGEAVTRRQQKIKRLLVAEAGGCCTICGYDRCLANLHFHHLDPTTKSFAMSTATGRSIAAYRAEARKCVLVCANCHGEVEAGLASLGLGQPRH